MTRNLVDCGAKVLISLNKDVVGDLDKEGSSYPHSLLQRMGYRRRVPTSAKFEIPSGPLMAHIFIISLFTISGDPRTLEKGLHFYFPKWDNLSLNSICLLLLLLWQSLPDPRHAKCGREKCWAKIACVRPDQSARTNRVKHASVNQGYPLMYQR